MVSIWFCSMVTKPRSGSTQMPSAPLPLGVWIDDNTLPVCKNHAGYDWQWQTIPGEEPGWVPFKKVQPPAPEVDLLGLHAAPEPRGPVAVAVAAQPKARPQPEAPAPTPKFRPEPEKKCPAPPPDPPPTQHPQPVQEGPALAQVCTQLVEALGMWQEQQTVLNQQQTELQQQALAWQQAALQQLREDARPQEQQQPQPMPKQHDGLQEQQPTWAFALPRALDQAVTQAWHQAALQQQPGSTKPLPVVPVAQAMWSQGMGAASGSAAAVSGSGAAYSGIAASDDAGAGSGRAGAASGSAAAGRAWAPPAAPRRTESCQWNCPEMHKVMQGELAKAKTFFHASVDSVADTEHHKADY